MVDYLGLAEQLRRAVGTYGGRQGERPGLPVEEALAILREKYEIVEHMFHGYDYSGYFSGSPKARLEALTGGADFVLGLKDGRKRYLDNTLALSKAAGLALHLEAARGMRDGVGYFQAVRSSITKVGTPTGRKTDEELNAAIRQIISGAVPSEGVVDVFGAAGLKRPDVSILSDEFPETVSKDPHRNLQIELMKKLLNDEIQSQSRKNVVQARKFSEMLERTLAAYQNRTLEAAQIILELIEMAKEMREARRRGEKLGLTDDEVAFYDALAAQGDVKEVMGDEVLADIAHHLVEVIRASVTIDWTRKESVRAGMRKRIKRLLREHGYPPDKAADAVDTVIQQAEQVCREWGMAA